MITCPVYSLDCKNAPGWDNLSITMSKLCNIEIVKLLYLIYMKRLETGRFPSSWKANVIPVHKKENRQLKKNYRPISLLAICGKMLDKLIFYTIYEFLCENQLLTPNQSGFRPGDLTINQLLSITHKIYLAFDELPSRETRAIDKMWLKSYGTFGCLFTIIKYFLNNCQQHSVLNGKSSIRSPTTPGVPMCLVPCFS